MKNDFIFDRVDKLIGKYRTRNPLTILEQMNVIVDETSRYEKLKGYCFLSCQIFYVMINGSLSEEEKRIVAAHELGHIILHKTELQLAPMKDSILYDIVSKTEYEANLFAADLLIEDGDIEELSKDQELNYFSLCRALNVSPDLMSFKLFSLIRRGYAYNMPMGLDSRFLAK